MFTKKSNIDVKKSTLKIQDCKKDSATRLRHLKAILDVVDSDEAKSVFETNFSHVYYILYDTFVQAEGNLKQRVHKAHREELDGTLWLLGKILCLLPELLARRWQCHSLSRIMGKLLHPGNSPKLRKEGVRYFLLWYQALAENAPSYVHQMFSELVPGLIIPPKGYVGPSDIEFNSQDILSHPNMKIGEVGGSVFHDNCVHPVQSGEICALLPPSSSERTSAPDPRDGLETLLNSMVVTSACLKWRDIQNSTQKHMKSFSFLLNRFKEVYLPVFCPNFNIEISIYEPKLDLPVIRTISKRDEVMSSCIVVLVNWISRFTHEKSLSNRLTEVQIDEEEYALSLLSNPRLLQGFIVRDVLYSNRENVNFIHEVLRQAFLLSFTTKSQIEAIKTAIAVYRDWMTGNPPPPFLLEPIDDNYENGSGTTHPQPTLKNQRLRADSYIGAISKENFLVRAGLQNVLQVFVTNAANVFLINTSTLNIQFPSKTRDQRSTPLNEQTDICKKVLNVYRTMVMNTRMEPRTWEQLLLVLLQVTSVILSNPNSQSKNSTLGGRLGQAIFQTLIVTWIRAHTNVPVNTQLWDKFLNVLTNLTYREELIIEWDKTMQTLTRVLARYVYNLNLQDLPLDRLADTKSKRRRLASVWQTNSKSQRSTDDVGEKKDCHQHQEMCGELSSMQSQNSATYRGSIPGTPALNRSYSEGSLAPQARKAPRYRRPSKPKIKVPALPSSVEHSLNLILSQNPPELSISSETLNSHRFSNYYSNHDGGRETFRRALSLDSLHPKKSSQHGDADDESAHDSRSPSPTASSGIEGGSMKDSPIQLDMLTAGGDSSSVDTQDDSAPSSLGRRSIISGGNASGWMPDAAAIMWKRMLNALGDVNKIPKGELHAQVFKHLVEMTINLIKIKQNQGISSDNQSTPQPPNLIPPVGIVAPWCYGALLLDDQFKKGKLWSIQLLCMLALNGAIVGLDHLSLFYYSLHRTLIGEDRDMIYAILKHTQGPRFLSLLLPGHTLLLLDIVHASAILLTSFETGRHTPRAEVASLLGSLLCYPNVVIPKPVLQPSEQIELMECPDLQDHILNIVLRCARREPSSKARCIALAQLGQWVLLNLSGPMNNKHSGFTQSIPHSPGQNQKHRPIVFNPRIKEVIQVLLQALQFRHRTIAVVAADSLKLCAERSKEIAQIERLPGLIISAICKALEIQNVLNPKDSDKNVLTALILCLGEYCMSFPSQLLIQSYNEKGDTLILMVLRVLHQIASGTRTDRIKLMTADEDFDMHISLDDVENNSNKEANYQTTETIQNCNSAIKLCAKAVAMHLVTHLGHFPMGIGAPRLSSLVDEQDDLQQFSSSLERRDSVDLAAPQVLNAENIQLFMLNNGLASSFIELPALKLPGGGATAGLVTAEKQVRVLLRDLNGKACWDASILYSEPKGSKSTLCNQIQIEKSEQISRNFFNQQHTGVPLDPLTSTFVGMEIHPPRHTLRHRPPGELPIAQDLAEDLDQLDDLLQYIGYTSPECLSTSNQLNQPAPSPLSPALEAQTISIILNQKSTEQEYIQRQMQQSNIDKISYDHNSMSSLTYESYNNISNTSLMKTEIPFQYCRLLFSHLGLGGWERRSQTQLLKRTEKLLRELRNVDLQKCRETHKMAVIYVASGQEDKNSILRNSSGSSTYEMFVSALGWEIELETHNGFLGGLPRVGCGVTAPYYATPFLEVIYHVSTRMPTDSPEGILTKTRHLGNDEVHIVWSEHYREYRRDILPTEFCDVLIVVYPLKNGLFRVTVNRKPDVPWFGPLSDESVVSGSCLASLVRATAINAGRAKRSSMPYYQQFYEERNRSLETVSSRYKESTTFEDFATRVYNPIQNSHIIGGSNSVGVVAPPLAAALIDQHRTSLKGWIPTTESPTSHIREMLQRQHTTIESPSPRPYKKLHHPFKSIPKKSSLHQQSPPESPTMPGRKFK